DGSAGRFTCTSAQSLATSGLISLSFRVSSGVASHVRPSGGPNSAQLFNSLAIAVIVNLASHERNPATGGVVNASKPNATPILPLFASKSFCQATSRGLGWKIRFAGLAPRLGTVSFRTARSLALL